MIATIYSQPGCKTCDRTALFFLCLRYLVQMRQAAPEELAKFPNVRTAIMTQFVRQDETPVIDVDGAIVPLDEFRPILTKWETEGCPFGAAADWPLPGVHYDRC